jgi:hypothetical protein
MWSPHSSKCWVSSSSANIAIDISQYSLLFGFFLLYIRDRVPFELLDSAQLSYEGRAAVDGGK